MGVGCAKSSIPAATISLKDATVEHTGGAVQNIQDTSLNSGNSKLDTKPGVQNNDQGPVKTTGLEMVDNLKSIEIENLNDKRNSKVVLNLPEGWYAKQYINDIALNFEFNS